MEENEPNWKSIRNWHGWKKFASWPGWNKPLLLHPLAVLFLAAVTAVGLTWIFSNGLEHTLPAYLFYGVSAYALIVLIAFLVRLVPWVKGHYDRDPVAQKLSAMEADGAFGIGMYLEQFVNYVYGGFKLVFGIFTGSAWVGADGLYNFLQGSIQLYQILRHRKVTNQTARWKVYRQCGYLMILVNLTMTGMAFQMIWLGRHEDSTEIGIIATAAFTFYKLAMAFISVAKDRKHPNPVDSAVYFLDFGQALYNLFVLQVGLLWVYGEGDFAQYRMMNSLTGGAVCLLVMGMGLYMIWRAQRDMKKLEILS